MRSSQATIGRATLKIDAKILRNVICWPFCYLRRCPLFRRCWGVADIRRPAA
jgi:hypothetical protein